MQTTEKIDQLYNDVRDYARTQAELARLRAASVAARLSASFAAGLVLALLAALAFAVLTLAAGFWLSDLLQSNTLGFLALGGIYVFLLFFFIVFREPLIKKPLRNRMIVSLLSAFDSHG